MKPLQKIELLFEEITKGNYGARDEFFEMCWLHPATLAHQPEIWPLLDKSLLWAKKHAAEHPDFLSSMNLSAGVIYFLADNYENGLKYTNAAQQLFSESKDEDGVAACSVIIGVIYRSMGEIDQALKFGLDGMARLTSTGKYKMLQIVGSYWIGSVYAEIGHLDDALSLFQNGLKVDYPPGIENMDGRLTNAIAGVYMKQQKFGLALENYLKTLDLCETSEESTADTTFKARGLTDLADYYYKMGDYPQSIKYNHEALVIRQEMKMLNGSITNYINLGEIFSKQGKFKDAIVELKNALKIAEEIRTKAKMFQIHQLLSDIYLGMGNLPESMAHFRAFHEIREDVSHDDMDRKVKNQHKLFQAEQTTKENAIIKAQKKEIELKNIELQETIDELTLARVSKKAKAITLMVAVVLFIAEELAVDFGLDKLQSNNHYLSLSIKMVIIFSLNPINKAIEHNLLKKVIRKKKQESMIMSE